MKGQQQVWTYFGASTNDLEREIEDVMARGVVVLSLAIGYGPSPAKAAGLPHGEDCWHAMLLVDTSGITAPGS